MGSKSPLYIVVSRQSLGQFYNKTKNNEIMEFWSKIACLLPKFLREEAFTKEVRLIKHPFIDDDALTEYFSFEVIDGSDKLNSYIKNMEVFVLCHRE